MTAAVVADTDTDSAGAADDGDTLAEAGAAELGATVLTGLAGLMASPSGMTNADCTWSLVSLTFSFESDAGDRKSTRLNSSHSGESRMPSSA